MSEAWREVGDLQRALAAKDREITAFAGERLAYCRRIAELIDALEKARGENDTFVSGMADLAERANAAIAKAVSERDSARALLRVIHGWIDNSPADRARIEKELGQ